MSLTAKWTFIRGILLCSHLTPWSSSALAQETEALAQRTVEGASRFLGVLAKEGGSVLKYEVRGAYAQIDVVGVSNPTPCITRLTFAPQNFFWERNPPAPPAYRPPDYVDIKWETTPPGEAYGHYRVERDTRDGRTLWGMKFWLAPGSTLETTRAVYWVFGIPSDMMPRVLSATEFLREKCQVKSDTGF